MKIYKKILNFGYGVCCLLPLIILIFSFICLIKDIGNNNVLNVSTPDMLVDFFCTQLFGETNQRLLWSVEWFEPFGQFNGFISSLGDYSSFSDLNDECQILSFTLIYTEWVVLVSFFRLFGSVFGCMVNFADRMLDKIGGTN